MEGIKDNFVFSSIDELLLTLFNEVDSKGKEYSRDKKDYKNKIKELTQVFYCLENGNNIFSFSKDINQTAFWSISEFISEILAIDPPIMDRYSPEILEWSYSLRPNRKARYMYGNRWNEHDQLHNTFIKLRDNPTTKRAVITIFEGYDTAPELSDIPCTTQYHFLLRDNKLDMTTFFRSHDLMSGLKYDIFLSGLVLNTLVCWLKMANDDMRVGKLLFYDNSLHIYPEKDAEKISKMRNTSNVITANADDIFRQQDIADFYKDLKRLKDVEEATYWQNFNVEDKISNIKQTFFRDCARYYYNRNSKFHSVKKSLEYEEGFFKKWLNK